MSYIIWLLHHLKIEMKNTGTTDDHEDDDVDCFDEIDNVWAIPDAPLNPDKSSINQVY